MKVRKATLRDFPQLKELKREFWVWELKRTTYLNPRKINCVNLVVGKSLRNKNHVFFVVEDKGRLIGYAWAKIEKLSKMFKHNKNGYIHDLYLQKGYHGKGLGSKLIDLCFAWFKLKKLKYWSIDVHAFNQQAHKLYKKKGFKDFCMNLQIIK